MFSIKHIFQNVFLAHFITQKVSNGIQKVTFLENDTILCLPDLYLMWCQNKILLTYRARNWIAI
jgi:hypothetical protein